LEALKGLEAPAGKIDDACSTDGDCADGLSCTESTCQPLACIQEAGWNVFGKKRFFGRNYDTEGYINLILLEAGVANPEDIYEDPSIFGVGRVKPEVESNIVKAFMDNPPPIKEFKKQLQERCQRQADESTVALGIIFRGGVGISFANSYFVAEGGGDEDGGIYTDICQGVGPQVGVKVAYLVSTLLDGRNKFLEGGSVVFGGDFTIAAGYGFSFGFNFAKGTVRVNSEIGAGVMLGAHVDYCVTLKITDFSTCT
jgi:hypothetical protein